MSKKIKKLSRSNVSQLTINEYIGDDNITKLLNLFEKVVKGDEFEFIFFSKKGVYLPQEKYIQLLKFFSKRSEISKYKLIGPTDTLDITYYSDNETNIRCTITGTDNINKLMRKVSMLKNHVVLKTLINLMQKKDNNFEIKLMKKEKQNEDMLDIDDFNLRARLSKESNLNTDEINDILKIDETSISKINYRYKQRTSLYIIGDDNSDEFIRVDLTYTRMSDIFKKLNQSIPNYELEIEYGTKTSSKKESKKESFNMMMNEIELLIKIIQQSNYIITKSIASNVIEFYRNLFSLPITENLTHINARQPITLEIQHVTEVLPNKYTVTDKADGDRHFMIIFDNRVYLLSTNLDVKYTGIILPESLTQYNGSVMDGELIFIPHKNRHLFLIFDCLFYKSQDVRSNIKLLDRITYADDIIEKCFIFAKQKGFKIDNEFHMKKFDLDQKVNFHHDEIKNMINNLNHDIELEKQFPLIRRKYFIDVVGAKNWEIFIYASTIWNAFTKSSDIRCPYLLDGLIFQPLEQAYVTNINDSRQQDYKWKPPEKNSIDFYIEFEKDHDNKIVSVYDNSYNDYVRNKPYKICKLFVGQQNKGVEVPMLFKEEQELYFAYIFLDNGEVRDLDGNILSDKTVVEFYYNNDPEILGRFKWVPIRTRYDKTESVIRFGRKYGNYNTVADKVWRSIINPVLMSDFDDLARGNIPEKNIYTYDKKMEQLRKNIGHALIISATKENVYFQKRTDLAKPMRSFHNWIKTNMIYTFCHSMYTDNKQLSVLDMGCGKGQDTMKFYYAKVSFYVGLDIDREGLVSAVDGAISRYNQLRKTHPNFPKMYFIQADVTAKLNIESQKNALSVQKLENEEFFKKFFSEEPIKRTLFDRINCQFAIHYMLKNIDTWGIFKKNINDYLRNGGYLLITTFDAEKIIKLIGDNDKYTQNYTDENGKSQILFEIVKKYEKVNKNVIIGTGNPIDVYISWFSHEGRYLTEYLVDSKFITDDLKKECNLDLIDTDSLGNQFVIHEPYLLNYAKYEENDETRKFLSSVAEFYKSNSINDGCKLWTSLFRYYVFRKQDGNIKQKGGDGNDDVIDFDDTSKFIVPSMKDYDNEYSCINSIYHVLKNHNIIPKSLSPKKLCSELGIQYTQDNDISDNLQKIAKNIIIEHSVHNDIQSREQTENVLNGINIFIIERDCNDVYEIELIKKNKKISSNDSAIILMKEGTWYVPVYLIDHTTQTRMGLYEMNHHIIQKMIDDL